MAYQFTKSDRKALIILSSLLLIFVLYLWLTNSRATASDHKSEESAPPIVQNDSTPPHLPTSETTTDSLTPPTPPKIRDTTIITTDRYPGPPKRQQYIKKLAPGATIDLNSADTLLLQRVPGIGASFARRIYKYREQLGGFYVVEQLQEVYGMDRERYDQIAPFMEIKTPVRPIYLSPDSIGYHPYLQYRHKDVLRRALLQNQELTWELLMQSGAFSRHDSLLLSSYLPLP